MKKNTSYIIYLLLLSVTNAHAQPKWVKVDSLFEPLPGTIHVYFTDDPIDTAPFRAYYLEAEIKDKHIDFVADTTHDRRLTPSQFYERNDKPLVVVNCTFFSFATNRSLNTVIMNDQLVAFNQHSVEGHGKDTFTFKHPLGSALGISNNRKADVAWLYTDSSMKYAYASELPPMLIKDSVKNFDLNKTMRLTNTTFEKWKMKTAVGGGPVLVQDNEIKVTNEQEMKFTGKAINDKHPRTAMGYTKDNRLIILMVEGRNNVAHGATLQQEAAILKALGCVEALNLDGGGSSCMLVNGKPTITVSDSAGQRPVPAVFMIRKL